MIQTIKTQCVLCGELESVKDDSGFCESCKVEMLNKLKELKKNGNR